MVRKEYSAGGVKHPFWFLEFKKAAILRDQGVTWEGLRTRSREENLFSAASPARAEMTCNTVAARMQTLPDSFLPMFVFGDPATQKLFCLLGCLWHSFAASVRCGRGLPALFRVGSRTPSS